MKGEKVSDTQKAAASRQIWAASMMTRNVEVFESIMNGDKVLVRQLEQVALRRALRGAALPPDDSYIASECLDFEMELENIQDPSDTIDMDFTFEARPIYRRSAQMISEDINA